MKKIIIIVICIFMGILSVDAQQLDCNKTYKVGSEGANVKYIQQTLNDLGICSFNTTSYYGKTTTSCIKKFQKKYTLTVSGTVDYKTCSKINSLMSNVETSNYNNTYDIPLVSPSTPYITMNYNILKEGDSGDNVRYLQKELNKVMNCNIENDGIFGENTKNCIIDFQSHYTLEKTGYADVDTVRSLNTAYKYQNILISTTSYLKEEPNDNSRGIKTLNKGERVNVIRQINTSNGKWYYVKSNYDYGYVKETNTVDTFIEIDITSQSLRVYRYGVIYLDTMVTTGKSGTHDTPKGYKTIIWKTANHYMKDANVTVSYWLKLNSSGIGIHDASWRGNRENFNYFGGNVYKKSSVAGSKYSGSHGCINTPLNKMAKIYEVAYEKMSVIVY